MNGTERIGSWQKRGRWVGAALAWTLVFVPTVVLAQSTGNPIDFALTNPLDQKYSTLPGFLEAVLKILVTIAVPFLVLAFVYTGFLFVKAQGNQNTLGDAKRAFTWSVIGGLLILGAWTLSKAIEGTVNELKSGTYTDPPALVLDTLSNPHFL